jgi:hypothetical protein
MRDIVGQQRHTRCTGFAPFRVDETIFAEMKWKWKRPSGSTIAAQSVLDRRFGVNPRLDAQTHLVLQVVEPGFQISALYLLGPQVVN